MSIIEKEQKQKMGQQAKVEKFEHCDDRMLLVSMNKRSEKANDR